MAFSVGVIREFVDEFVTRADDLVILGCALAPEDRDRLVAEWQVPEGRGEYGVMKMLRRSESVEPGGTVLGFEPMSYEYGLQHSWLCNSLEREVAKELDITPDPSSGLFVDYPTARIVTDFINGQDVGAEPGLWLPWCVTRHELP